MRDTRQKVHLVSGATSGIGAAIYRRLIAKGDDVVPILRNPKDADRLNATRFVCCDFSNPEDVRAACSRVRIKFDSFINAAGVAIGQPVWETDIEQARQLVNVNLISPMIACGALRAKLRDGAAVILVSSQSAYRGGWDDFYNASKGGINAFIKSFAVKMAPRVRVIGIAPGITLHTRMTINRREDDLDKILGTIPMRRFAKPDEIAELVISLLGTAGAYMTGCVVDVNGGNYLR